MQRLVIALHNFSRNQHQRFLYEEIISFLAKTMHGSMTKSEEGKGYDTNSVRSKRIGQNRTI